MLMCEQWRTCDVSSDWFPLSPYSVRFNMSYLAFYSHIQYFWEAVQALSKDERSQLINFCSGRSRLPAAASDFHMSFKLTAPPPRSEKDPDDYLPIARTCFFSLSLPKYTSAQVCNCVEFCNQAVCNFVGAFKLWWCNGRYRCHSSLS
jgi:hypothetical protein